MSASATTIAQNLARATQHHQGGRHAQAQAICRQILARHPDHAETLQLSGIIAFHLGQMDAAIALMRRAIAAAPRNAAYQCNLGNILHGAGQLDEAIVCFQQALALNARMPEIHFNLANSLNEAARVDEAIASYEQALALKPIFPEAWSNLGNAQHAKGQLDQAIASYRKALSLRPNYAEAQYNLGNLLKLQGHLDQAIECYEKALRFQPDYAPAHANLGVTLRERGQSQQAQAHLERALQLNPRLHEAHNSLGNALQDQKRMDEAVACFQRALTLRPDYTAARNNLGNVLRSLGRPDEAIDCYRQVLAARPDFPEALSNLGTVLQEVGRFDQAIECHRKALLLKPDYAEAHSSLLFGLHYHPAYDAAAIYREHRLWNQQHAEGLKKFIQPHTNSPIVQRRLKIGYVSPDLREHVVARFLLPLLTCHDRDQFEIHCYAQVVRPDAVTARIRSQADQWHDLVGLSDQEAADQIRRDGIDILVDLALHTGDNRLLVFAQKPAPVQVTYLAYCSTSGLDTMDYRLTDPYLDPPGTDLSVYSEQTVRLPETYWCFPYVVASPPPPSPPSAVAAGHVTFGSLNHFRKVGEGVLTAWARLLGMVPRSRLLLYSPPGSPRQWALQILAAHGIEAERIEFTDKLPVNDYFNLYQRIDVALDPFPYGGGTTTCDALWMGVPVVSLRGRTAVGRAGASILSNIGLSELVVDSLPQYLDLAAKLAQDTPRLTELRSTLRQRMMASPLMNAPRFAATIEAVYRGLWQRWCAAQGA